MIMKKLKEVFLKNTIIELNTLRKELISMRDLNLRSKIIRRTQNVNQKSG